MHQSSTNTGYNLCSKAVQLSPDLNDAGYSIWNCHSKKTVLRSSESTQETIIRPRGSRASMTVLPSSSWPWNGVNWNVEVRLSRKLAESGFVPTPAGHLCSPPTSSGHGSLPLPLSHNTWSPTKASSSRKRVLNS